jgi:hypothetical protein
MVGSFSGGVLTITLNDGSTVSGRVTDSTELECQAPEPQSVQTDATSSDGGDNGGGDNGNGGGDNGDPSGDNGDQGGDQGDNEQTCSSSALASRIVVQAAELDVSSAGAVWQQVELITR